MATDVVMTIGTAGDYTTIADFISSTAGDLVGSGLRIIGELIDDKSYDEDGLTLTGATTDADNYRIIRGAESVRPNGKANRGARIYSNAGAFGAVIILQENYSRLENLSVQSDGNAINYGVFGNAANSGYSCSGVIVYDCVYGGFTFNASGNWDNCIAHNVGVIDGYFGPFSGPSAEANQCRARHCTAIRTDGPANIQVTAFRYLVAQNTAAFNYGGAGGHQCYLNLGTGSDKYASSDSTGSEAGLQNLDPDTIFVSTTSGSVHMKLKDTSSALYKAGSGVGLDMDIEGQARHLTTPDIGADEWHPDQNTIGYLSRLNGRLPMSGIYDLSGANWQIPSGNGSGIPDPQARLISDALTSLEGQIIGIPTSGVIAVASGLTNWFVLDFET